jgi:hypothetical protein
MLYQAIPEKPEEQSLIKDRINLRFKGELEAMNMQDYSDMLNDILSGVRTALWAISAIAGIVGGIVVTNTMLMSVMERIWGAESNRLAKQAHKKHGAFREHNIKHNRRNNRNIIRDFNLPNSANLYKDSNNSNT